MAQGIMGPLFVVAHHPCPAHLPNRGPGFEEVGVKRFGAVASVEAFDAGVLIGFAGFDIGDVDIVVCAPVDEDLGGHLRTVVHANNLGHAPTLFDWLFSGIRG